jgi:hypothetical protein
VESWEEDAGEERGDEARCVWSFGGTRRDELLVEC